LREKEGTKERGLSQVSRTKPASFTAAQHIIISIKSFQTFLNEGIYKIYLFCPKVKIPLEML
jgi:hypothetical protein